jgi:hypothetical protein
MGVQDRQPDLWGLLAEIGDGGDLDIVLAEHIRPRPPPRLHPEEPPGHPRKQPVQPTDPRRKIVFSHHKIERLETAMITNCGWSSRGRLAAPSRDRVDLPPSAEGLSRKVALAMSSRRRTQRGVEDAVVVQGRGR